MNIFSRLFKRKPKPPFVEYPDGRLTSPSEAVTKGMRIYRHEGGGRRAYVSWQGQGSRVDSYHIAEATLNGDYISFERLPPGLEELCATEGFDFARLRGSTDHELNVGSLSVEEAARLIEMIFVKHLRMKRWEDTNDYCVGFEYESPNARRA